MRSVLHNSARIGCGCVLCVRNCHTIDWIPELRLKADFRGPSNTGVDGPVHDPDWGLAVMDCSQDRFPCLDLVLINRLFQWLTAGFAERTRYLIRHTLPLRIRHGQSDIRTAKIFERVNVLWVPRLNHDRQIIGCVADNVLNLTALLHLLEDARSCFVDIGPDLEGEVTQGERIAGSDLLAQDPGRKCLVEDVPFERRVLLLESGDELREDKKLIAPNEDH